MYCAEALGIAIHPTTNEANKEIMVDFMEYPLE
jgi:hypothetical protein